MCLTSTAAVEAGSREEPANVLEARLRREADALARLSHPNVLEIMKLANMMGTPTSSWSTSTAILCVSPWAGGRCRSARRSEIVEQVARAVDAVHEEGILHRAISPSSVMMLHDGSVKLMDSALRVDPMMSL